MVSVVLKSWEVLEECIIVWTPWHLACYLLNEKEELATYLTNCEMGGFLSLSGHGLDHQLYCAYIYTMLLLVYQWYSSISLMVWCLVDSSVAFNTMTTCSVFTLYSTLNVPIVAHQALSYLSLQDRPVINCHTERAFTPLVWLLRQTGLPGELCLAPLDPCNVGWQYLTPFGEIYH